VLANVLDEPALVDAPTCGDRGSGPGPPVREPVMPAAGGRPAVRRRRPGRPARPSAPECSPSCVARPHPDRSATRRPPRQRRRAGPAGRPQAHAAPGQQGRPQATSPPAGPTVAAGSRPPWSTPCCPGHRARAPSWLVGGRVAGRGVTDAGWGTPGRSAPAGGVDGVAAAVAYTGPGGLGAHGGQALSGPGDWPTPAGGPVCPGWRAAWARRSAPPLAAPRPSSPAGCRCRGRAAARSPTGPPAARVAGGGGRQVGNPAGAGVRRSGVRRSAPSDGGTRWSFPCQHPGRAASGRAPPRQAISGHGDGSGARRGPDRRSGCSSRPSGGDDRPPR
jgi:hypothetical protein